MCLLIERTVVKGHHENGAHKRYMSSKRNKSIKASGAESEEETISDVFTWNCLKKQGLFRNKIFKIMV